MPALLCAAVLPVLLRWASGFDAQQKKRRDFEQASTSKMSDDSIVKHACAELERMGSMSAKELVKLYRLLPVCTLYSSNCC